MISQRIVKFAALKIENADHNIQIIPTYDTIFANYLESRIIKRWTSFIVTRWWKKKGIAAVIRSGFQPSRPWDSSVFHSLITSAYVDST